MTMQNGIFNKMRLEQLGGVVSRVSGLTDGFCAAAGDNAAVHCNFLANAATNGVGMHTILGVVGVCSRGCGSFVIRHVFVEFFLIFVSLVGWLF